MVRNSFVACMLMASAIWPKVTGEEYIVAMPGSPFIRAVSGDAGGWIQIHPDPPLRFGPNSEISIAFTKSVASMETALIENKSVRVSTGDASLNIYGHSDTTYFTPFPISALGTKYLVSSCYTKNFKAVLVIATHSQKTTVGITLSATLVYDSRTYGNGETLTLTLEEYQTFTVISEFTFTGTIVTSDYSIAVFSGTLGTLNSPVAYDQLLPVEHFGQEYAIGAGSLTGLHLQIISEHNDTVISIDEREAYLSESRLYHRSLNPDESVYFNTTRRVSTTLCRRSTHVQGFLVVPPMSVGTKQSHLAIGRYNTGNVRIITTQDTTDIQVTTSVSSSIKPVWSQIGKSRYHVGIVTVPRPTYMIISSYNNAFIALVYHEDCIYSTGYLAYMDIPESTPLDYQTTMNSETSSDYIDITEELDTTKYQTLPMSTSTAASPSNSCNEVIKDCQCIQTQIIGATSGCLMVILLVIITVLSFYSRRHACSCPILKMNMNVITNGQDHAGVQYDECVMSTTPHGSNNTNMNTDHHDYSVVSAKATCVTGAVMKSGIGNLGSDHNDNNNIKDDVTVDTYVNPYERLATQNNISGLNADDHEYGDVSGNTLNMRDVIQDNQLPSERNNTSIVGTDPHNYADVTDDIEIVADVNTYEDLT